MKYQVFIKNKDIGKKIHSFFLDSQKKSLEPLYFNISINKNTYKKSFGKTLIVGGADGYLGAAIISGKAALYSGSRYVEIMTTKSHSEVLPIYQPELITSYKLSGLDKKIISYKNLLIGPGMSNDSWSRKIFLEVKKYLATKPPDTKCIVDGGFLSMLAKSPYKYDNWVMTPHIGEAAKLLGLKASDIEANRLEMAKKLQSRFGGIVVLKGPNTIVATKAESYVCQHGNQAMGTAGMGDCLAGTILSLVTLTDIDDRVASVLFSVGIHSLAADLINEDHGSMGLLASDVIIKINKLINKISVK